MLGGVVDGPLVLLAVNHRRAELGPAGGVATVRLELPAVPDANRSTRAPGAMLNPPPGAPQTVPPPQPAVLPPGQRPQSPLQGQVPGQVPGQVAPPPTPVPARPNPAVTR
jgi:hypothetical protein